MYGSGSTLARHGALVAVALALSATAGLAFSAWLVQGPAMFNTLVEQGLAWCF